MNHTSHIYTHRWRVTFGSGFIREVWATDSSSAARVAREANKVVGLKKRGDLIVKEVEDLGHAGSGMDIDRCPQCRLTKG